MEKFRDRLDVHARHIRDMFSRPYDMTMAFLSTLTLSSWANRIVRVDAVKQHVFVM